MKKAFVYADGGSRGNPGRAAIGIVLFDSSGKKIKEHKEYIGITTNNVAEYKALIKALELGKKYGEDITVIMDSELVIRQVTGQYRIKAKHLIPFYEKVKVLEKGYLSVKYQNVSREDKRQAIADRLVNEALDA